MDSLKDKKEKQTSCFIGKHSEVMGDVWNSLFGSSEEFLMKHLRRGIQEGTPFLKREISGGPAFILKHPSKSVLPLLHMVGPQDGEPNIYLSSTPLLTGSQTAVQLDEKYVWESHVEGEFAGHIISSGNPINFYDPLFLKDEPHFRPGGEYSISLAGLAYSAELFEEQEFKISKGDFYQQQLADFLAANPGKTKKDFPACTIRLTRENFRSFLPTQLVSVYDGVGKVEEVQYSTLFDIPLMILTVNFGHEEDSFRLKVYVSSRICQQHIPAKGDTLHFVLWLTGYFL